MPAKRPEAQSNLKSEDQKERVVFDTVLGAADHDGSNFEWLLLTRKTKGWSKLVARPRPSERASLTAQVDVRCWVHPVFLIALELLQLQAELVLLGHFLWLGQESL